MFKTDLCVSATRVMVTDLFLHHEAHEDGGLKCLAVAPQKPKTTHDHFAYASNMMRRAVW